MATHTFCWYTACFCDAAPALILVDKPLIFRTFCSLRILILCTAIEVHASFVADGVTIDEPARAGVIVAVSEAEQTCTRVGVVAMLTAEADGIVVSVGL